MTDDLTFEMSQRGEKIRVLSSPLDEASRTMSAEEIAQTVKDMHKRLDKIEGREADHTLHFFIPCDRENGTIG